MKRIALLTSGGDAPGMNAAVRAITRKALYEGLEVFGIMHGYEGLLNEEIVPLQLRDVGGIVNKGGTILKTARCLEFQELSYQQKGYAILRKYGIEALVVIGGDGSMAGAESLSKLGMPTITIPGTIDNDMAGTEYTIGFDTALNTVLEAVNKIRDTTTAHERVAVIEVMGRHAGHIAVQAGIACGAEIVLIPERSMSLDEACRRLYETYRSGKTYSIIIVAEGAYSAAEVHDYIEANTEFSPSMTILGYLQRGGSPSARDSIMAALMSEKAIDLLLKGTYHCLVGSIQGHIVGTPYEEAKKLRFSVTDEEYELINILSN